MGKVNVKLLQGIEDTEGQINKEKQMPGNNASDAGEKAGASKKPSDTTSQSLDIVPETQTESFKVKGSEKKKRVAEESSKLKTAPDKAVKKQVFSFRAAVRDINVWKAFATSTGRTMESIGSDAMNEYMKKHRMSDAEAAVFKALLVKYEGR